MCSLIRQSREKAAQIAAYRYTGGLVGYLDVVYAQSALLANQRIATQIGGQQMVATVVLIKAIGGGWLQRPSEGSASSSTVDRVNTARR